MTAITNSINNDLEQQAQGVYSLWAGAKEKIEEEALQENIVFVFSSIRSHRVQLSSQITDYWLENNTAIQDTISIQPVMITLEGLVGEVVFKAPYKIWDLITNKLQGLSRSTLGFELTNKLTSVSSLVPKVDNYTQLAKNAVNYIEVATERYIKAWNALNPGEFTENDSRTNQQRAFETICNYWLYKTPLNVSTPYGTFSNMYIQNADFVQDESETVSNISITLKQTTFKEVEFESPDKNVMASYNQQAQASEVNNGNVQGKGFDSTLGTWVSTYFPNARYRKPGG